MHITYIKSLCVYMYVYRLHDDTCIHDSLLISVRWGGWRSNSCLIAPGVYIEAIYIHGIILTASSVEAAGWHANVPQIQNTSQRQLLTTWSEARIVRVSQYQIFTVSIRIFPPHGKDSSNSMSLERYEVWVITGTPHFQAHRSNRMPLLHGHLCRNCALQLAAIPKTSSSQVEDKLNRDIIGTAHVALPMPINVAIAFNFSISQLVAAVKLSSCVVFPYVLIRSKNSHQRILPIHLISLPSKIRHPRPAPMSTSE